MAGSEGEERREQVLRMLLVDSEDREQRSEDSLKQQPLNFTYCLFEGRNIGYSYDRTSSLDSRSVRESSRHWTLLIVNSGENPTLVPVFR